MTQPQPNHSLEEIVPFEGIKVIAFDADDTLWNCQSHFAAAERRYCDLLKPYADAAEVSASLFRTETANMPLLGYGSKAFTLSLIENAVAVSGGRISGSVIGEIVELGKGLLNIPTAPLTGVERTLATFHAEGLYRLVVFTKGELLDQENKLRRSRLQKYFSHVEIVSDKTRQAFLSLCRNLNISPSSLLMVGNSFKSDIVPALEIGAAAVHVPFHVTWQLEHTAEFPHERLIRVTDFDDVYFCVEHSYWRRKDIEVINNELKKAQRNDM